MKKVLSLFVLVVLDTLVAFVGALPTDGLNLTSSLEDVIPYSSDNFWEDGDEHAGRSLEPRDTSVQMTSAERQVVNDYYSSQYFTNTSMFVTLQDYLAYRKGYIAELSDNITTIRKYNFKLDKYLDERKGLDPRLNRTWNRYNPRDAVPPFIPRKQQRTDPIEKDPTLNCYHYDKRNEMPFRYRRCYRKGDKCNQKWRWDVREFRDKCAHDPTGYNQTPDINPFCGLPHFEPDIEVDCVGHEVWEDENGQRIWDGCSPAGHGPNDRCHVIGDTVNCLNEIGDCIKIEPQPSLRSCRWVNLQCNWSNKRICAGDWVMCAPSAVYNSPW